MKRYEPKGVDTPDMWIGGEMEEDPKGEWVRYDDIRGPMSLPRIPAEHAPFAFGLCGAIGTLLAAVLAALVFTDIDPQPGFTAFITVITCALWLVALFALRCCEGGE